MHYEQRLTRCTICNACLHVESLSTTAIVFLIAFYRTWHRSSMRKDRIKNNLASLIMVAPSCLANIYTGWYYNSEQNTSCCTFNHKRFFLDRQVQYYCYRLISILSTAYRTWYYPLQFVSNACINIYIYIHIYIYYYIWMLHLILNQLSIQRKIDLPIIPLLIIVRLIDPTSWLIRPCDRSLSESFRSIGERTSMV